MNYYNYNKFYSNFDTLIAFLMECLNWRCSFGGSVYVVGSSSKGLLHGTLGVDYFHNPKDVIDYCYRNGFQIIYGNDFDRWLLSLSSSSSSSSSCQRCGQNQSTHHHDHDSTNNKRQMMCVEPIVAAADGMILSCPPPPRKRARCVTPPNPQQQASGDNGDYLSSSSLQLVQGMMMEE